MDGRELRAQDTLSTEGCEVKDDETLTIPVLDGPQWVSFSNTKERFLIVPKEGYYGDLLRKVSIPCNADIPCGYDFEAKEIRYELGSGYVTIAQGFEHAFIKACRDAVHQDTVLMTATPLDIYQSDL